MLNLRSLCVALALVAIFCVSFAVMWRQRAASERAVSPVPMVAVATMPPITPESTPTTAAPLPDAMPVEHAAAGPPIVAPTNTEGPDLPVILAISTHPAYGVEDDVEGQPVNVTKNVTEGILMNTSDQALDVSVIEVDFQTHATSQTQVLLGKNMQKHVGVDQGLKMQSGDDITLRSPSYRDQSREIP